MNLSKNAATIPALLDAFSTILLYRKRTKH